MAGKTASQYRDDASRHYTDASQSYARSDTDGCLSQWASGVLAAEAQLNAYLADNNWMDNFAALFDASGNLVAAKLIRTRYGLAWALLATDDPKSAITGFVSAFPRRESTMKRKGYYEGTVRCPAHVALSGNGNGISGALSVRPYTTRNDEFSRNVEIIDNGMGAKPERPGARRA